MMKIFNVVSTLALVLGSCGSTNIDVKNDFVLKGIQPVNSIQRAVPRVEARRIKDFIASTQVEIIISKGGSNFRGRGTILKDYGVIVTSLHVVEGADSIVVYIGNQASSVKMLTGPNPHELALVSTGSLDLSAVPNVEFDYTPEDESKVMFMVNHMGFLEGKVIEYERVGTTLFFLYTTPTVPGTSGSGVFDEDGELIGVHFGLLDKAPIGSPILLMRELEYETE